MVYYRTFKRSCTDWESFARARKMTESTGLTLEEAREECDKFNDNRTKAQVRAGTKMEFEET
jgi:hypothetical protein